MSACGCRACGGWTRIGHAARLGLADIPDEISARLQSPIEEGFLRAFIGTSSVHAQGRALVRGAFSIEPQARVGPFLADFVVGAALGGRTAEVAVELDGHEFHAKTPEQVEKDRQRDRAFVRLGVVVLRFSGREVTRDAHACAAEVEELLTGWLLKAVKR